MCAQRGRATLQGALELYETNAICALNTRVFRTMNISNKGRAAFQYKHNRGALVTPSLVFYGILHKNRACSDSTYIIQVPLKV